MADWKWRALGQEFGPVTASELQALVVNGTLSSDDEVLRVGSEVWQRIMKVPELQKLVAKTPADEPPTAKNSHKGTNGAADKSKSHAPEVKPPAHPRTASVQPEPTAAATAQPVQLLPASTPAVSMSTYRHVPDGGSNRTILVSAAIILAGLLTAVGVWHYLTRPVLIPLAYHKKPVVCVAFSPDRRWLATAGDDNTLCLWSATDGVLRRTLQGHAGHIMAVGFSPDSERIITGAQDNTAKVWDVEKGVEVFTLQGHTKRVDGIAFSPDGALIATGAWDGTVRVWDSYSGQLKHQFPTHKVNCLSFSPDSQMIVTCSWDWTIRAYEVATGKQTKQFIGHRNGVYSVTFHPEGRQLLSASEDGTIRIWDFETGKQVLNLDGQAGPVYDAIFTADGKGIISGGKDCAVKVWDPNIALEKSIFSVHPIEVRGVACCPDGETFASVGGKASAFLWKRYLP